MRKLHKITSGGIVAAVVAFSALTTQAQPNLLVNPGFETSPAGFTANPITQATVGQGWATFGASQTDMSASSDYPHSGSYALLAQNGMGNNWNPQGAYQVISGVTAGDIYTLSAYFLQDTPFTGTYTTPIALQVGFGNWTTPTTFTTVTSTTWGFGPAPAGSIPALNTWYQGSVSAVAPAGATDAIVYLFFMDNGQTAPDSVYFDDASLTAVVPEPSSFALLGLAAVPFYFLRRRQR
jgi:hypothetical protein